MSRTIVVITAGLSQPSSTRLLADRIAELSAQLKAAEKTIAQFEAARLTERVPALVAAARPIGSGRHPGPIRPARGAVTASAASTFCSSRTFPGQS